MAKNSDSIRVATLATDGVEEAELVQPRKALDEAGFITTLISPKPGQIQAMKHDDKSKKYDVGTTLDKADPQQFDAVLLPGGALNADVLRVKPQPRRLSPAWMKPASQSQ